MHEIDKVEVETHITIRVSREEPRHVHVAHRSDHFCDVDGLRGREKGPGIKAVLMQLGVERLIPPASAGCKLSAESSAMVSPTHQRKTRLRFHCSRIASPPPPAWFVRPTPRSRFFSASQGDISHRQRTVRRSAFSPLKYRSSSPKRTACRLRLYTYLRRDGFQEGRVAKTSRKIEHSTSAPVPSKLLEGDKMSAGMCRDLKGRILRLLTP
jgi:hypothetical protein